MGSTWGVVVLGRRQQGLLTQKAQQGLKLDTFFAKFQGFQLLAALFSPRMCIPTRVVSPAVTSTAGFLRANIARMNKGDASLPCGDLPVHYLCVLSHNAH